MKGWNICDDGQLLAQYQMEREQSYQNPLPPYLCNFTKTRTQSTLKINTTKVQKTSLKSTRIQQKPKENCDQNSQSTKDSPPVYLTKGSSQNPSTYPPRTEEKPTQNIIPTKMNPEKFNPQASQSYYVNQLPFRMSSNFASSCNVKINYINPVQSVRFCRESKKIEPTVPQACKTLRRMNTEPSKFFFQETTKQEIKKEMKQEVSLCRSMEYEQPVKKSLKSTQNLNQIKCISAESIADSEEPQDEISIVISPLSDDLLLNKPDFNSEYWDQRINIFTYNNDSY